MARKRTKQTKRTGHYDTNTIRRASLVALGLLLVLGREITLIWNLKLLDYSSVTLMSNITITSTAAAIGNYLREQVWNDDENTTNSEKKLPGLIADPCHETTIVITTNMIPIAPSIAMINATIHSLHHLKGLCNTSKILIACDNIHPNDARSPIISARFHEYIFNHIQTFGWWPHVQVVVQKSPLMLANSLYQALQLVDTEFLYVLQHDMPFLLDVNHTALVQTFREYPNDLKIVRFPLTRNIQRQDERGPVPGCYNMSTPVNHVNGLTLIKTHKWSDHNMFSTTEHYHEVFAAIFNRPPEAARAVKAMEHVMNHVAFKNCSYYGQFYYGEAGAGPWIGHLDGRQTQDLSRLNLQ